MDSEWKIRIEKEGRQYIIVKVRQQGEDEEKEYWTGKEFVIKSKISQTHIFYSKQDAEKELVSI